MLSIEAFSGIDDSGTRYFFEEVEITKEEWDKITDKFLEIGSNTIKWYVYEESNFPAF